ncbi:MYO15 protein, partial [Pomatorhinus ruficollis]|nr:MYO15 protein [Pomatorhinus ruficollis]
SVTLPAEFRVGNNARSIREDGIKKRIVVAARDNWANYFSRLFPVQGEKGSDVQILGVSHRGMRLLKVEKAAGYHPEHLKILCSYSFADVLSVEMKGSNSLEFSLKTEQLILHSPKAPCIKTMVELFMQELRQVRQQLEQGLKGTPAEKKSVADLVRHTKVSSASPPGHSHNAALPLVLSPNHQKQILGCSLWTSVGVPYSWVLPVGSWELKSLVKPAEHSSVPIQASLLRYSDSEVNEAATKNFQTLMQFMGDQPKHKHRTEIQCIYEILQLCKEKENLHDEIYCQVIKQSFLIHRESELRGWLLLNLLTGYFLPSKILMPYATKFLQLASSDPSTTHHDIAKICQSNLRKNFLHGGRRHLPFPVEMEALLKGHGARRLVVLMPGGMEYLTRIRTFTVAKELLQEICEQMGIGEQQEIEDFVLFAVRSDDKNLGKPIKLEEYLHDYLLEDSLVTLTLRRLIWRTPLHFDNQIYTDVHYGQVLWDYLNGRILLSQNKEMEMQVGLLAMLQHWAKVEQQNSAPSREELKEYIPKTLQPSISPKALQNHVATLLRTRQPLQPLEAKIQFIEQMMKLPFFGYTIFVVERISDDMVPVPCFLGVNKEEIIMVDSTTQAVSRVIPLKELQKMRTLRPISDGGFPGLELSYGSPDSPKAMWVELPQAKELYHTIVVILDRTELHS